VARERPIGQCLLPRTRVSEARFYARRKRLAGVNRAPTFVPMRVIPDAAAEPVLLAIEVVLSSGHLVRVCTGFDQTTREHVLAVLEGRLC
jgi:hypothetical protein